MIWNQNSTPVTKKLACISQMWMSWFSSAVSNKAGTCQRTITTLNETSAVHGLTTKRPNARSGCERRPSSAARTRRRRGPTGRPCRRGSHGAPATMRIGAKNAMRMCSIMWTKK